MTSPKSGSDQIANELGLIIDLEWDPIKNEQLGQAVSQPPPGIDDNPPSNIEGGSKSGNGSYLAICPTTIQSLSSTQTLFVWRVQFHPGINRRFKNAVITIKFTAPKSDTSVVPANPPRVSVHAPRKSFGSTTDEARTFEWGFEIPISAGVGPANIEVTPSMSSKTSKTVQHAFTIIGTARGAPHKKTCVWTLEENNSSGRGLPSEVQFAIVLEHNGTVCFEVDAKGETGGGKYPPHWVRASSDAEARRKEIDPSRYTGKLHEYDVWRKEDLKRLLDMWTGEVDGALVNFNQQTVRAG